MSSSRRIAGAVLAGSLVLGTGGVAWAMSDGFYTPADQRCDPEANDTHNADTAQEGCQNATLYAANGDWEIARAGTMQTPEGTAVHEWSVDGDSDASQADPSQGGRVYFGADDNLDTGEHDGARGIGNGPSDGGGILLEMSPDSVERWLAAASSGDTATLQTHPVPLVTAGTGACADGVCMAATTERRTVYQGGGDSERDAVDYQGVRWDPETCGGPTQTRADCDDPTTKGKKEDIRYWDDQVGTVSAEPGVQVYEDPDPEGSPAGPYPLPAAYVGTCGVLVGGADLVAPESPVTNDAGQIDARQGC